MARLTLYMTDAEMLMVKTQSKKQNLSVSAFVRTTLNDALNDKSDVQDWWNSVAGKLNDDTFIIPEDSKIDSTEIEAWG